MADITTEVLIIGTGPAGSATAALLASYGVDNLVINRYRWLANTPRAHITNQRTMEVLRDLGRMLWSIHKQSVTCEIIHLHW